ncbi:hypothetical protein GCM10011380_09710 [Sphingomonas metalli]|uniref:Phosphatidylglycerol lysyltransferase C-terminal domain-containing protein n=1 Tax=Sphingomonas metalli TaxID=1779358 RepID=A0A916SZW8_9SPHN|nr:bifunctional lysylphosphatidylglycerol flippase/synthetase MprF [Sphingomonas metalli]GGB22201.1 hypothetical protein GCM10011380_09710 [Sphingomonas metalli]
MADLPGLVARHRRTIAVGVALLLAGLGFAALDALTREVHFADLRAAMHALSGGRLALALGFTAASYLALTIYDVLALRVIGRPLPWRTAALASFSSYTLSHNLGIGLITGGSARYRVYTAAGLDGPDIARVIGIAGATFWIGVIAVAGVALLAHPGALVLPGLTLGEDAVWIAGVAIVATTLAALGATAVVTKPIRLFGFTIPLPRPRHAIAQLGISVVDLACASAALFVLIPGTDPALLPAFILAYALGIVATVITHVPGGVGVFEAVVMAVLPGDRTTLLAALVAYRVIYYVLPLALGILLLALSEGRRQRAAGRLLAGARPVVASIAPLALAAATFGGGAVLLLSGALPALRGRMGMLDAILPLPFIEASHIAASLVGAGLLSVAPGLYRRLDGANIAARVLLVAGAAFSIAKGIDYEEAIVCLTVALLLHWTRGAFYRRTALTQTPISAAWVVCVGLVLGGVCWAGFFAFRRVPYSDALWLNFGAQDDAPRFLRAMLATVVALIALVAWRLFAPARQPAATVCPVTTPEALAAALAHADRTDAMLALTGDKRFLWSEGGEAFVMYQIAGASWIVMGDPVGPREAWPELLWRLREMADRAQGRLMLYEMSSAALDLAIGMGRQIIKFGEEAIVDLTGFTLDTPRLRAVRRASHAARNKGAAFRIVPADAVPVILDELEAISNAWMADKGASEKRFSLGRFDRDYIRQFDVAIVTVGERIVAFANLWLTANRREASVDLMRYRADTPPGTMDFLFTSVMLWAKERGYRRFSLGMAPLSGIDDRRLAPAWARISAFVFRNGERIYGFKGLRTYKEKYAPVWEPRYIAGPRGLGLIAALHDLSRLIGGRARPAREGRPVAPSPTERPVPPARQTLAMVL